MSSQQDSADRYSRIAILLHWAIALLILTNLVVGYFMEGLTGPTRRSVIGFHVSSGMTILALTAVRVLWRLTHDPPPYPPGMRGWERHAASMVHVALYVMMVAMPLSGWALLSANPPPGSAGAAALAEARARPDASAAEARRRPAPSTRLIWGLIPMRPIHVFEQLGATADGAAGQKVLHDEIVHWHTLGSFLIIGLLLLHLAGALKHQFMDGQSSFARMGIGRVGRHGEKSRMQEVRHVVAALLLGTLLLGGSSRAAEYDYPKKNLWYQDSAAVKALRKPPAWNNMAEFFAKELYSSDPLVGFSMKSTSTARRARR